MPQSGGDTLPSQVDDPPDLFPDGGGLDNADPSVDGGADVGPDGGPMPDDGEGGGEGVGEPTDDMPDEPGDVPANTYCATVTDWSANGSLLEEEVLQLVNNQRAAGADCGSQGTFAPASALIMDPALRCAARTHSTDMGTRQFFDHINPDGENPGDRLARAGYQASTWGENIAFGYPTAQAVMDGWMQSDGHCANIMRPMFTEIGVGYGGGDMWTQVFAAP